MTLVEVVASIALMSTLLVMMLIAHSRHLKQIHTAHQKVQAAQLLDRLVAEWFESDDPFPRNQSRVFADNPQFAWRTIARPARTTNPDWTAGTIVVQVFVANQREPILLLELLDDAPLIARMESEREGDR